ncbi:MAG: hypothetical protein HY042_11785, partial [Spirochaetia bacterium]|nr:hypothetical protein [Spirochaetia bacterium]
MLFLYNALLGLFAPFYLAAVFLLPAGRRFRSVRRAGRERLEKAVASLSSDDKVIWLHASSVGEMDQALGIVRELKARGRKEKIFLSVFSMSVTRSEHPETDCLFHLPFDFPWAWTFVRRVQPVLFATMTWDVFPNLLRSLADAGIPSFLCSAALNEESSRLKKPWIWFHRRVYAMLSGIGAVDER